MAKGPTPGGYQPKGEPVDLTKTKPPRTPSASAPPAPRMFPIMRGPAIPWAMIEPHEFQCQLNHYQSLERLAQRGGLSAQEAIYVLDHRSWDSQAGSRASRELRDW